MSAAKPSVSPVLKSLSQFPLLVLGIVMLLVIVLALADPSLVGELFTQYGLIGLFVAAIFANASILFPVPFDILMFGLSTLEHNLSTLLSFALVGGVGATIGEMTAYLIGLSGVKSLEKHTNKEFLKMEEIRDRLHKSGMVFVFLGALTPFPFDLVGIAAGVIKYDIRKFFLSALAGKIVRYVLIVMAGFYGIELLQMFYAV